MSKKKKFTEDQLNKVKELAKTKTLQEIAIHFNMNKSTFVSLRKEQPEIDTIYYKNTKEKQIKLYTSKEILEIGKMAKTLNLETIIKKLGTSLSYLKRARANQPELDAVLINSIEGRDGAFNYKTSAKIRPQRLECRTPNDISPEEAIERFHKLKEAEKKRRQIQELKEIYL